MCQWQQVGRSCGFCEAFGGAKVRGKLIEEEAQSSKGGGAFFVRASQSLGAAAGPICCSAREQTKG